MFFLSPWLCLIRIFLINGPYHMRPPVSHLLLIRISLRSVHVILCAIVLLLVWRDRTPVSVTAGICTHYIYCLLFICLIKTIILLDGRLSPSCFLQLMLLWVAEYAHLRGLKIFQVCIWENITEMWQFCFTSWETDELLPIATGVVHPYWWRF